MPFADALPPSTNSLITLKLESRPLVFMDLMLLICLLDPHSRLPLRMDQSPCMVYPMDLRWTTQDDHHHRCRGQTQTTTHQSHRHATITTRITTRLT